MDIDIDGEDYVRFTGRQRLETAANTIRGILQGVVADKRVNDQEMAAIIRWCSEHKEFADRHPFNEIIPRLQVIVADGFVDEEERADMLWLAERFGSSEYYDTATAEIQVLHGFLAGIMADGVILETELESLGDWLDERTYLRACWPYDEIDALVTAVMADGRIDDAEQEILKQFFNQFVGSVGNRSVAQKDDAIAIEGVCASCPELAFEGRQYCFTGKSDRGTRDELVQVIERHGARFNKQLTNRTDYLIVGADGNACWAYSCYGRKVEDAVQRRKKGQRLLIVHEYDLWDAIGQ